MPGGVNNPNNVHQRRNRNKENRVNRQRRKTAKGTLAINLVENTNTHIGNLLDKVVAATTKRKEMLLLTDKAHAEQVKKVKWVTGIKPARAGPHGTTIRATRLNKKKAKKLIKRAISEKAILEAVNANEVEMEI